MIELHWPQMVWLSLAMINLGMEAAKDGETKTGRHSFIPSLIATALIAWLLDCGGFFG